MDKLETAWEEYRGDSVEEMTKKASYDVLRLIEHGKNCYISSENVEGKTLVKYLKYHPNLEKSELYAILREITKQLELIHRCRGNPSYQYVNPYSIIRAEDGRIYYLDMKSAEGKEHIRFMQRRDIREHFLPPDEKYYQHASMELDIYGLGRTFQYILASIETEPHLGRREEVRLKKIISKALGNQSSKYQSISDIRKQIPTYKKKEKRQHQPQRGKMLKKVCITTSFILIICGYFCWQTREKQRSVKVSQVPVEEGRNQNSSADQERIELAIAYFLDIGDEEKSLEYLKKVKNNNVADNLRTIIISYQEREPAESEAKLKNRIQELERWLKENKTVKKEQQMKYLRCL